MKKVGRDASVHPKTLQSLPPRRKVKRPREICPRCGQSTPVTKDGTFFVHTVGSGPYAPGESRPTCNPGLVVTQVHPGVWATALEIAGGDASLIEVISSTRVLVSGSLAAPQTGGLHARP